MPLFQLKVIGAEECKGTKIMGALQGGANRAFVPMEQRSFMPSDNESLYGRDAPPAVLAVLGAIHTGFPSGLIRLGAEPALHAEIFRAHDCGRLTIVDKDMRLCVDISNPRKYANEPDFPELHDLLARVYRVANAGDSISSGGGTQEGGLRVHMRIVPAGEHTTPGKMFDGHIDSATSLNISARAKELFQQDPEHMLLGARIMMTAGVPNATDLLLPESRVHIKVGATAAGAPVAMGLLARGHVVALDGSVQPRRLQVVFDMALADLTAMSVCLAEMRVRDLVSSCPEWGRNATPAMQAEAFSLGMLLQEQLQISKGVSQEQSDD